MSDDLSTSFPQLTSAMVDGSGFLTQPWLWFLRTLWTRTGGAGGTATTVPGDLLFSASPNDRDGYLLCNGQAVSRTLFSGLFGEIGVTWGAGDGTTTFNVPNFNDRSPLGAGGAYAVGDSGGAASFAVGLFSALAAETDEGFPHALMQASAGSNIPTQSPFLAIRAWIKT